MVMDSDGTDVGVVMLLLLLLLLFLVDFVRVLMLEWFLIIVTFSELDAVEVMAIFLLLQKEKRK